MLLFKDRNYKLLLYIWRDQVEMVAQIKPTSNAEITGPGPLDFGWRKLQTTEFQERSPSKRFIEKIWKICDRQPLEYKSN